MVFRFSLVGNINIKDQNQLDLMLGTESSEVLYTSMVAIKVSRSVHLMNEANPLQS